MKRGVVTEALPNAQFRVDVDGRIVICYLAGRMMKANIRVSIGDKVDVILPPGSDRGRIDWRY